MAKKPIFRPERRNLGALLASFIVISAGLTVSIMIAVSGSNEPLIPVLLCFLFFGLISMIPLSVFRPEQLKAAKVPKRELWKALIEFLRRPKEKTPAHRVWKRKKSSYIPQPHGSDYTTFVPERYEEPKAEF